MTPTMNAPPSGFGAIDAAPPPPLPAGPWLEHRILEAPWPLAVAFMAVALILATWARSSSKPRLGILGAGACLTTAAAIIAPKASSCLRLGVSIVHHFASVAST